MSQRGLTLYLDLVAGAVWWLGVMFDFCRYDALLQVQPYFGRRGVFYIGSSAVESARGENFGGADGAHFYQV